MLSALDRLGPTSSVVGTYGWWTTYTGIVPGTCEAHYPYPSYAILVVSYQFERT